MSVINSLGHAETGILADIDLVEHLFRALVGEKQGTEYGGQETERDGDDTRVLQFQDRLTETHDGLAVFTQNIDFSLGKRFGVLLGKCCTWSQRSLFLLHGGDDLLGTGSHHFRIGHVRRNHNQADGGDRTDHQAGDDAGGVELAPEQ